VRRRGLSAIPSVVQLPGGRYLSAIPFRIVAFNDDGTPRTFEILPPGETWNAKDSGDPRRCALFADEGWIRSPVPEDLR
jgi:hypothetical protein